MRKPKTSSGGSSTGLQVQLNIIVLLVAVSVLALFLIPARSRLPLVAVLLAGALVLSVNFRKKYRETRAWLHEQPDKKTGE